MLSGPWEHPLGQDRRGRSRTRQEIADLIRLQLFPYSLEGVSALTEHRLEQALLCLFTFSLDSGKTQKTVEQTGGGHSSNGSSRHTCPKRTCKVILFKSCKHVLVRTPMKAKRGHEIPGARLVSQPTVH